jgi:hypothetical protein
MRSQREKRRERPTLNDDTIPSLAEHLNNLVETGKTKNMRDQFGVGREGRDKPERSVRTHQSIHRSRVRPSSCKPEE